MFFRSRVSNQRKLASRSHKKSQSLQLALRLFVTIIVLIFSTASAQPPPTFMPTTALQNGLVAYFPFDGGSVSDISGYGHTATSVSTDAGSSADRNGVVSKALRFNN